MSGKSTTLMVRLPRTLKEDVENKCDAENTNPSEVTRALLRDYSLGHPTVREILNHNKRRFEAIFQKLTEMEV